MKKYVIYKLDSAINGINEIVRLQDEAVNGFDELKRNEDWDNTSQWMKLERSAKALTSFIAGKQS
ncbi:MAG: hypothetical protein ABI091_26960 [Ferruginibacter sp.]